MLPFNTTIPAVVVAVLGFAAGALVFDDLLHEAPPSHTVVQQGTEELRQKPKQAAKTPSDAATKTSAASGQGPQG